MRYLLVVSLMGFVIGCRKTDGSLTEGANELIGVIVFIITFIGCIYGLVQLSNWGDRCDKEEAILNALSDDERGVE